MSNSVRVILLGSTTLLAVEHFGKRTIDPCANFTICGCQILEILIYIYNSETHINMIKFIEMISFITIK